MKGKIITIFADPNKDNLIEEINEPVSADVLQGIVAGYIELVPGFDTIFIDNGKEINIVSCVAFCNKDGKLKHLNYNTKATNAWHKSFKRHRMNPPNDYLVGNVVMVIGDDEFLESI